MDNDTHAFCGIIHNRSTENRQAMRCFANPHAVLSPAFSILRQELDSMIRVIYLLQISDLDARLRLIQSTLRGERWTIPTSKGKFREVTDREMVECSQQLQGWTRSVYKFGCAFIHLSDFHSHLTQNPFDCLTVAERQDILAHMRSYHGGPASDSPDMKEISEYLPRVFDKIADNLKCYIDQLERNKTETL